MVAQVLAMVNTKRAQRAVIDAALAASGDDQAMLLGAVAQGARRFGSQATAAQSDAMRELVRSSTGPLADAAAAAFGAMGLPSSEAVDLIIKSRVPGAKAAGGDAGSGAAADEAAPSGDAPAEGGDGDLPAAPEGGMGDG
jgi:hypothetical protein